MEMAKLPSYHMNVRCSQLSFLGYRLAVSGWDGMGTARGMGWRDGVALMGVAGDGGVFFFAAIGA